MPAATPEPAGDRRLEQLYEVSKLFAAFDVAGATLDAALKVIAKTLPLESAILIEAVIGGHTNMVVWPSEGSDPLRVEAAKLHAADAYTYLVGGQPSDAHDRRGQVREDLGPTLLPSPDRSGRVPGDARRFIVIPLVVGRGVVFGALQLEGAARLDRSDLEFVNAIANQLAIALDRNRAWSYDVFRRREAQRLQAKYELLVDHLDHAFVWEADAESRRVTYVSAQLERMLGYPRRDCITEADWWTAHVHPEDHARLRQTFERALVEPGNKRCEHRCLAADGSLRWLRTSIHLVGVGDEPPHFQGVSFDITVARTAQEQVREQLSFTSAMASSLAEGTLAIDLEGRITFINDAAAGLLGDRETLGRRCTDVVHIETEQGVAIESPLTVAVRTGRVRSESHVLVRADRGRFPVSYTATPIRRDGRVTGAVLAFDDISERKHVLEAERFLMQAGAALSASLESADVAGVAARLGVPLLGNVCFVDVVSANDQLRHAAWAHADPDTQHALDGAFGPGPRPPMFATVVAEVLAFGRPILHPVVADAWFAVADRPIVKQLGIRSALSVPLTLGARQLGALTFCMTGERQHRTGDVALAEELGRRSALAIEHARLYAQARHAIALREQTLAIVSHDLRTPLSTIMMATSLLGDVELPAGPQRAQILAVEKIQTAAERMERMIGDLLDFASIEAGRLSMLARPHDATGILDEVVASFDATATKRGIRLTSATVPGLAAIQCDRDRILQVLGNLVSNALKSMVPGGAVVLGAVPEGREVVFSVADTGPGILPADQKRLFERYWRSPDAAYKGTGLGLAIARGLVEAHHGRLWVDSEAGRGATFYFTLPLA